MPVRRAPRACLQPLVAGLLWMALISTAALLPASVAAAEVGDAAAAAAPAAAAPPPALQGIVRDRVKPVSEALVYVYNTGTLQFRKVQTDDAGRFLFHVLPAGIYQIIAFKSGFAPAIEQLERWSSNARQRLELELEPAADEDPRGAESYWTIRSRIPPDVLRDVSEHQVEVRAGGGGALGLITGDDDAGRRLQAQMAAHSGTTAMLDGYQALTTSADVGIRGQLGSLAVGIQGHFKQLAPQDGSLADPAGGEMQSLALHLETPGKSELQLLTASGEMGGLRAGELAPVDLEHYQLRWSGRTGERGRAAVSARYLEESNFYQPGFFGLADVPDASRTLDLRGSYARQVAPGTTVEAGVRYRERMGAKGSDVLGDDGEVLEESFGVYGRAGARIQPRILVEIGLYSEVQDGSLSLMPQSRFIVDLGKDWRASTSVAHRIDEETATYNGFTSAFYADDSACQQAGEACYKVFFTRGDEGDETRISVGGLHREYSETLRLYFSNDVFFDRLESLTMVRGDALPEVQFSVARRISPHVLARLESSFARGGGGIVYATDAHSYENQVRYLVTSLDTRFQQTATGVFIAFHHLEQALNPRGMAAAAAGTQVELERLQLMLTQDLSALADLSSNWAVRLNMELSRGASPYTLSEDELYKTLTGGFSVSF